MVKILVYVVVFLALYSAAVVIANRSAEAVRRASFITRSSELPPAGDAITLLTWNLGYGALGEEMDFAADGGTRYFPHSRADVRKNLDGILHSLDRIDADVFLLQEVARSSPLNYWHDVQAALAPRFQGFDEIYEADIATRLLPPPLQIEHGSEIKSRLRMASAEIVPITREDNHYGGLLQRAYRMQVARLSVAGGSEWVIVNVHLAAFDEGGLVRRRQLEDAIRFAKAEFAKGNRVAIGGDYNMEIAKDLFPHRTEMKDRFWLHDFPKEDVPPGWTLAFDLRTPTVRTVHKPFVEGENYTAVIDGFILSPNLIVDSVQTTDLAFRFSDHQPVAVRLRAR